MKKTSIDDVDDIEDENLEFYEQLCILLRAINDWDERIFFVEDYILALNNFLGNDISLTKTEINLLLERKNAFSEMWNMESVSVLLTILENKEDNLEVVLDKLIFDIKNHLGHVPNGTFDKK